MWAIKHTLLHLEVFLHERRRRIDYKAKCDALTNCVICISLYIMLQYWVCCCVLENRLTFLLVDFDLVDARVSYNRFSKEVIHFGWRNRNKVIVNFSIFLSWTEVFVLRKNIFFINTESCLKCNLKTYYIFLKISIIQNYSGGSIMIF